MAITKRAPSFSGISSTEVGYLDGVTPGTAIASKAVVLDSGGDFILLDNHVWNFGTGSDVQIRWDATDLDILAAADDSVIKFGNGTNSFDIWIYGDTASDRIVFDASAKVMDFDGVDLQLKDADILHFGDTIADDARIVFDGTQLSIIPLAIGGALHIGDAADTEGNQVHIFDGGAEKPGAVVFYSGAGTPYYVWVDTTGDLRIHTAYPTDEDMDGAAVGGQS